MKAQVFRSSLVAVLLAAAMGLSLLGCFGGGQESPVTTRRVVESEANIPATDIPTTVLVVDSGPVANEDLSTFKSKDPFIPQAVATTTTAAPTTTTKVVTTTTTKAGTTTTTRAGTTTTTKAPTTTTKATTTTPLRRWGRQ
jgi:hypothetical protein